MILATQRGETMAAREVPWFAVINLGNSIIGVSILAMPWCFRECGVVLATVLIIFGGFMTKISCNLLLRASKATRRQSYEFLAYHTLGTTGKLAVEMSIIGLAVCTCIAFFVIMGDLGPVIVSKWGGFDNNWELRVLMLVFMAIAIVLPLGLRRSVESLSNISTMSILFYMLFSSDIILDSLPVITSGAWLKDLVLWRSSGTLKGVSIFALAFSCQTVLFVVYDSLPEKTPKQMEGVVNRAVTLVGSVYIVVGFFGYVTYNSMGIKGDILLNFAPGLVSELLRLGFTLSVALSFPLVIFPCRASIYTLFFSQSHSLENPHGGGGEYIPPSMFKLITLILVIFTLVLGITIPNVEVILGLTGATLGSLIAFIFPALIYLRATGVPNKGTGKVVLAIGILILICSTYDNLQSMQKRAEIDIPHLNVEEELLRLEQAANNIAIDKPGDKHMKFDKNEAELQKHIHDNKIDKEPIKMIDKEEADEKDKGKELDRIEEKKEEDQQKEQPKEAQVINEKRLEPPIPHAPMEEEQRAKPPVDTAEEDKKDLKKQEEEEEEEEEEEKQEREKEADQKKDVERLDDEERADTSDEKVVEKEEKVQDEDEKPIKEEAPKKDDDKASLEKIVEGKVIEQEHKQEEQDKQLKEIKEKQEKQEKIIKQQAEELERLRIQHEEEQKEKEKEKVQKIKEEKEKELKEKDEAERKAKQDELLRQQQELQKKQEHLQQQQMIQQQQQQQQQQQPPAGGFPPDAGIIPQQMGGLPQQVGLPPVGADGLGLKQDGVPQAGGLVIQQQQQPGLVDNMAGALPQGGLQQPVDMAGGLQQPGDLIDGAVMQQQQQVPLVVQQQQQVPLAVQQQQQVPLAVQQQQQVPLAVQPQQVGMQQQMGQPIVPQQAAAQPVVGDQVPLQDGGMNMQQGAQGIMNQQVAAQGNMQVVPGAQAMDQLPPEQQPLDRVQRSIQDGQLGGIQQQPLGLPQQGVGVVGDGQPQMQGIQQQLQADVQQNLQLQQLNQQNLQQPVVPVQQNLQQPMMPVQQKLQEQGQVPVMQQQPVIQQQQQFDKVPALLQNNLENNIKPIVVGADSNAANRQLKLADHADSPMPKTDSKDQNTLHVSKDQQVNMKEGNDKNEERTKNELNTSSKDNKNPNQKNEGHKSDAKLDDDTIVRQDASSENELQLQEEKQEGLNMVPDGEGEEEKKDTNVQHEVLVEEEDADMELAKSLEQQLNNQFKQVGAMAQGRMIKSKEEVKTTRIRKEEV